MKFDRKLVFIVMVAVVAASGCTSQNADDAETDNTPSGPADDTGVASSQNNTVFYTDSGFQPDTLEIEQGESVTWIDRSSGEMWVGSDRHPIHSQYDGTTTNQHCSDGSSETFDQCSTGERFKFTFEKTGEWSYHNHVNAGEGGTVVVN